MSRIVKLNSKEKNLLTFLMNADKPLSVHYLASWLGCNSREVAGIIFRVSKGIRILHTNDFEFYLAVDEESFRNPDAEQQDNQGQLI